jgi:hypothetical protein
MRSSWTHVEVGLHRLIGPTSGLTTCRNRIKTSNNGGNTTCQNLTSRRRPRGCATHFDVPADPNTVSAFLNLCGADIQRVYEEWSAKGATFSAKPLAPSTNKPNGDTHRHIRRTERLGSKEIGQYG